jgi:comEC/rec2 family protein
MNNLFNSKKELLLFFIVAFTIFGLNLSYEFYKFKDFKTLKFRYVEAVVEQSYLKTKNDKTYRVLKLKNGDFSFYTTTKKENELKRYDNIKLGVITDKITFKEYIKKSFYLKSFNSFFIVILLSCP